MIIAPQAAPPAAAVFGQPHKRSCTPAHISGEEPSGMVRRGERGVAWGRGRGA
jgi:hypothetical protein